MNYHFGNRIIETATTPTTSTGTTTAELSGTAVTLTFPGGATTAGIKFVSSPSMATGDTVFVHVFQTATPSLWATIEATFTTGTPNTLTWTAGKVKAGSAGAGVNPTWSGGVTCVHEGLLALQSRIAFLQSRAFVDEGVYLAYSSTTAITIKAGNIVVNGQLVTVTDTTKTSASTMANIAGTTVTLAANSAYFVYVSDAGVFAFEKFTATGGDSDAPVYNSTYDYWAAPSTGVAWRRIGKFWTNGSSQPYPFHVTVNGRARCYTSDVDAMSSNLISSGVDTSFQPVTNQATYFSTDDKAICVRCFSTKITATGVVNIDLSVDAGSNMIYRHQVANQPANSSYETTVWIRGYTGTLHYRTGSANQATLVQQGFEFRV